MPVDTVAPVAAPLTHREIMNTLSGILIGTLLAALDQSIVTTAVPAIVNDLGGFEHLSWVFAAYLLTATASTPIYGKMSDLYGRGRLLLISIVLFVASSVCCALAESMGQLIAARALQGLGGGGLVAMAQAIVADLISPRERGRYQGYFASVWAMASIGGPIVGGLFVDHLSWRWVFWINLPIGIAAFLLCRRTVARLQIPNLPRRIDYLGAVLLTAAVTVLLLVTTWGGSYFPWVSPQILGLLALGLLLLGVFILQELRAPDPIMPPRLFTTSIMRTTNTVSFVVAMAMFGGIILMPVYFQLVLGIGAGNTGLLLIPLLSGSVGGAFISGRIMRATGRYKALTPIGLGLATIAYLLLATMDQTTSPIQTMVYLGILGLGFGPTMPVMMVAVQNMVQPRDIGVATSSVMFTRSLGGSFGVALLWSMLLTAVTARLATVNQGSLATTLIEGGPAAAMRLAPADRILLVPALLHAFHIVFLVGAFIVAIGLVVSFLLKEEKLKATVPQHLPAGEAH